MRGYRRLKTAKATPEIAGSASGVYFVELAGRPKGDARKVRIAERLRRETTMTLAWIGHHLYMGAPGHVSCLLYRKESNQKQGEDENSENKWF